MEISEHTKAAARELVRAWRGRPEIVRRWDRAQQTFVGIASLADSPQDGVTAFGTLGLSDHSLGLEPNDVRVELVGASASSAGDFGDVLATCAFNAIKDGLPVGPGAIHRDAVSLYGLSTTMAHALFTNPFPWGDGPRALELEGRVIGWVMVVPISEAERQFADQKGSAALMALLEEREADTFDLNRPSVV